MHATNEQCALIMGWVLEDSGWYDIPDHRGNWTYSNKPESLFAFFDPQHNLNHAALVEARIAELGLKTQYILELSLYYLGETIDQDGPYRIPVNPFDFDWFKITATAQTRCDAAWATWQQYQQRAKE